MKKLLGHVLQKLSTCTVLAFYDKRSYCMWATQSLGMECFVYYSKEVRVTSARIKHGRTSVSFSLSTCISESPHLHHFTCVSENSFLDAHFPILDKRSTSRPVVKLHSYMYIDRSCVNKKLLRCHGHYVHGKIWEKTRDQKYSTSMYHSIIDLFIVMGTHKRMLQSWTSLWSNNFCNMTYC